MEALKLTSAPPSPDAVGSIASRRTQPGASDESDGQPVTHTMAGGLHWTCRNGFGRIVALVDGRAWADPQRAGWTRVKHNGSRDVWRAALGDGTYYVKYFFCDDWIARVKHMFRGPACLAEWNGGVFAIERGIPAVRPAGFTPKAICKGRLCSILVTEGIEPGYPLDEFWLSIQSDPDRQRSRSDAATLVECLAGMIAHAHQSGFEHLDMHPANILVQPLGGRRYCTSFVDLQCARLGVPIDDNSVVRNLAQLNQWFRRHSSTCVRLRFLRAYMRWRNEHETRFPQGRALDLSFEQLLAALKRAADRHAERLWAQRDRRTTRSGRYFARVRLAGGWRGVAALRAKRPNDVSAASAIVLDAAWWKARLANPLGWFSGGAAVAKDSHSAAVVKTVLPHDAAAIPVIVKRPLARNMARSLRQALPPSRCRRAWSVGHQLLHRDIPAARPLAILERRIGPFVRDSVLLTEFVPGAADLEAHLRAEHARLDGRRCIQHRRAFANLLARELRRLHERGFVHRDCKAQNILIRTAPALSMVWIDMDGIRRRGSHAEADSLRALARLHVSLRDVPGLTRTDWARFLKAYYARFGARVDAWRVAWRALEPMVRAKLQQRAIRTAWKREHYGRE